MEGEAVDYMDYRVMGRFQLKILAGVSWCLFRMLHIISMPLTLMVSKQQ